MLSEVLDLLRCPVCAADLSMLDASVACTEGHSFDVARQGYVSLLTGREALGSADTASMVEHRSRLLGSGHYAGIASALSAAVPVDALDVLEVGAGTAYYLSTVLGVRPRARGLALDLSKYAVRRAARLPRVGAAVSDVWRPLPVYDECLDAVLCVFAPRGASELRRVLSTTGRLVVVTPTADHLAELVERLPMLSVDDRKAERLADQLGGDFTLEATAQHQERRTFSRADVVDVVGMGPSAFHLRPDAIEAAAAGLPERLDVTVSVQVSTWLPRPTPRS